jgi:hypothetical protein
MESETLDFVPLAQGNLNYEFAVSNLSGSWLLLIARSAKPYT